MTCEALSKEGQTFHSILLLSCGYSSWVFFIILAERQGHTCFGIYCNENEIIFNLSSFPLYSFIWCANEVPTATILGGPDLHVDKGSTINLTCTVKYSPEPPAYIFWYHHDEVSRPQGAFPLIIWCETQTAMYSIPLFSSNRSLVTIRVEAECPSSRKRVMLQHHIY